MDNPSIDPKQFFLIEGLDGAGKSTVGPLLAKSQEASFIEVPMSELIGVFGEIPNEMESRVDYFMRCNSYCLGKITPGKLNFICRYCPTTVIGNSLHFGVDISVVEGLVNKHNLPAPIKTFLLIVSREEQKRRLSYRRNLTDNDRRVLCDECYSLKMTNHYLMWAEKESWEIIDTTNRGVETIASEILDKSKNIYRGLHEK